MLKKMVRLLHSIKDVVKSINCTILKKKKRSESFIRLTNLFLALNLSKEEIWHKQKREKKNVGPY